MAYDRDKAALPPGTARARAQGCTCMFQPVQRYTIIPGCPLHDYTEITHEGNQPWDEQPTMVDDSPHTQL